MIAWLADTLVMTGALMALILLVRRPVARLFGPMAAYALWALPMIRLVLPPLSLPRGLIPQLSLGVEPITAAAVPVEAPMASVPVDTVMDMPQATSAAEPAATDLGTHLAATPVADPGLFAHVPWTALLLTVWLGGAAVFLAWRIWNYRLMRREILAEARLVARSGDVRIIESPAAGAPLAFGVFEKLVALPQGFLASVDSESSDFAIAHELEHHAGNDLLAIMALQPLFALHWFNPLGWAAWRALRADQEAACDARVMAGCGREMRARYGRLIASFAAATRLSLAAPMAGTLSGEKPIIQRLKALGRAEVSPARKVAARSLFALAVVSVPFTATVTYAAMEAPEVPEVPAVPEAPVPPEPAAPSIRAVDPDVPDVPNAPDAPAIPASPAPAPAVGAMTAAAPMAPPVPPTPPVPPAVSLRDSISRDVETTVTNAMRNVPEVRQTVSSDGKVQVIHIVRRDGNGQTRIERKMTIDSRCPADSRRAQAQVGQGATVTSTVICTGAPKHTADAAVQAIAKARAAVAANQRLDAATRTEILADLDAEMIETRADVERDRAEAERDRAEAERDRAEAYRERNTNW
ncbi:beta-lactamase regulating signal transducer with metallopeptidase domain [Novosphingobium sp. PhB165]|uniref:M56 family metallopeptidase n=1 Tax=Novosphingobium sp. PhB165 TaxID=2485105 RepID=UPI0010505578|nr:M56 family metallopeptidase [Novosphingobium sp. PhB165]TCM21421.1 beta-lactamase regulating signal transducer with metallopeptidase domain [Novosphingobium sp. PhB165]